VTETSPDPVSPSSPGLTSHPRSNLSQRLAVAPAVVFTVSLAFPVTAALSKNTSAFPEWWGPLDVGIAFLPAILAIAVLAVADRHVTQRAPGPNLPRLPRALARVLALVVVFFLAGDRITWRFGLLGLAWRSWLLLYSLPAWYAALERPAATALGPHAA
jgi:hypothetical protein